MYVKVTNDGEGLIMRKVAKYRMGVSLHNTSDKGSISYKHNNREITTGNPDIDSERLRDNVYYVQGAKNFRQWVNEEFREEVERYNAKQQRSDRKIDDMYEKLSKDKKTSLEREMIVQVGDKLNFWKEDGARDEIQWGMATAIMDQYAESFQERNPNFRIYNMALHLDEASPHLHINYVPVYHAKRGLEKRVSWEKAASEMGIEPTKGKKKRINKETGETEEFTGITESQFQKWRDRETDFIEQLLKENEIERHRAGNHKHMSVPEYKDMANELEGMEQEVDNLDNKAIDLEKEVSELEKKRSYLTTELSSKGMRAESLQSEYNSLERKSEHLKGVVGTYKAEEDMYSFIRSQNYAIDGIRVEPHEKREGLKKIPTGKVIVDRRDWENVKQLAIAGKAFQIDVDEQRAENYRLKKKNEQQEKDKQQLKREITKLDNRNFDLLEANEDLRKENKQLQKFKRAAHDFFEKMNLSERFKEFVQKRAQKQREQVEHHIRDNGPQR